MSFERNRTKEKLHEIIFEADTPAGKLFDVILMICILLSVVTVLLETVPTYHDKYANLFYILEWTFTIVFTLEYFLRLYVVYRPKKYATSFFGIVDLLSIIPTYLSIIVAGTHTLVVLRALRLLRVFRILKLDHFMEQGRHIMQAMKRSIPKISVFLFFILVLVTIIGSIMYLIEGDSNTAFDSIPRSIYWAIVTLTTVGYGDISPVTPFGQAIAAVIMISGYAIIAVPTGIVTAEAMQQAGKTKDKNISTQSCRYCSAEGHDDDAEFCKYCGEALHE